MSSIKEKLYHACLDFVAKKEATILSTIESHQEDLNSENKSSAGDKHETGRAMLQLEMEKASQQFEVVHQMKSTLQKTDISKTHEKAALGSLIYTNAGNYFLAISIGEIEIEHKSYFVVSVNSPIGRLLLGKKSGESLTFHKQIKVIDIT